jgi:hypothetical protein
MKRSRLLRGGMLLVLACAFSTLGGYVYDVISGEPPDPDPGVSLFGLAAAVLCVPAISWGVAKAQTFRSSKARRLRPGPQ